MSLFYQSLLVIIMYPKLLATWASRIVFLGPEVLIHHKTPAFLTEF